MKLSKRSFLALAAIGWADGALQRVEMAGLLRAAKESGLTEPELTEIEHATKNKTTLADLDLTGMSEWEQVLTYALGSWFAALDGVTSTSEHAMLVELGTRLGLAEGVRKRAQSAAFDISCLPEGGRPDRFDFEKLRVRLGERLPQLAKKAE